MEEIKRDWEKKKREFKIFNVMSINDEKKGKKRIKEKEKERGRLKCRFRDKKRRGWKKDRKYMEGEYGRKRDWKKWMRKFRRKEMVKWRMEKGDRRV